MIAAVALHAVFALAASLPSDTGAISKERWEALVRHNAASNPHAQFDTTLTAEMEEMLAQQKGCFSGSGDTSNTAPQEAMSASEVAATLASVTGRRPGSKPAVDWRTKGAVTAVKNQGAFGTCWSFAVTENIEGLNFRQGNKLVNLSNQELIDCCPECQGRSEDISFEFLLNNTAGKVCLEDSYPYAGPVQACKRAKGALSTVQLHTFGRVQDDGSGDPIVAALVKHGPMGLGVDATCFAGYKGGVITNCTKAGIDHAVLMVAAGTDPAIDGGVDYFTIKNSWGAKWGEHGYVRVQRGAHPKPQCGIGSTVWSN